MTPTGTQQVPATQPAAGAGGPATRRILGIDPGLRVTGFGQTGPYRDFKGSELVLSAMGAAMTAHPGIRKISYTGSTATGKKVMAGAADALKRITLELGGSDAYVVLEDADLERAAAKLGGKTPAQALVNRLKTLGYLVTTKAASSVISADANGKTVVVIASTNSSSVNTKFRTSAVLVVLGRSDLYDILLVGCL